MNKSDGYRLILISLSVPLCDVLSDAFLMFVIIFKYVFLKPIAFSVEKEYECYLEKENYEEFEQFSWQCFSSLSAGWYNAVSLSYSAVMERHIVFLREIMALHIMRKETENL
jgi:hypothetical protein